MTIKSSVKNLAKQLFRNAGYEVRKLPAFGRNFSPRIVDLGEGENRFKFWIANYDASQWYNPSHFGNQIELEQLTRMLGAGDRILEVGSNHGFFAVQLAKRMNESGLLIGVEPVPKNVIIAQAQLSLNDLGNRAKILHLALGEKDGSILINDRMNGSISLGQEPADENKIEVLVRTGDSLDQEFGPFNFLKIDVEGFECSVLRGCTEILKRRPKIALEVHQFDSIESYGGSIQELTSLLSPSDYEIRMFPRPDYRETPYNQEILESNRSQIMVFMMPKS